MFACLALIFSYVEAIIPFNIGIPGVKLGLANLVIVIALYELNFRYAFVINMIRILLAGLFWYLWKNRNDMITHWLAAFCPYSSCGF